MASLFQKIKNKIQKKHRKLIGRLKSPVPISPGETRLKVHLGCGHDRLEGFVNVDCQTTAATDRLTDLNSPDFESNSVALAYSHAFFEHLFRDYRLPHLTRIYESLVADGVCCYIGLPHFRNIAKLYLEGEINLAWVYRYTHGDPEGCYDPLKNSAAWLAQLHKSLFDEEAMSTLLKQAGFGSFVIFCYAYPRDEGDTPINIGFYAAKNVQSTESLRQKALEFLKQFDHHRIRINTLQWL